jgi:hypothetical protein
MEDRERIPDTQPFGALEPPRRRPPTAVGLMTLPPSEEPEDAVWYPIANRMRLVAQAILGTLFAAVGPALAAVVHALAAAVVGGAFVLVGGSLWWRVAAALREDRRQQEDRALQPPARWQRAA